MVIHGRRENQVEANEVAAERVDHRCLRFWRTRRRVQKVGVVSSDKMQKTVLVRVDRLVLHRKYRRYVRRTSQFMAHDEMGSTIGDKVRIIETGPLSARKRWRVVRFCRKRQNDFRFLISDLRLR